MALFALVIVCNVIIVLVDKRRMTSLVEPAQQFMMSFECCKKTKRMAFGRENHSHCYLNAERKNDFLFDLSVHFFRERNLYFIGLEFFLFHPISWHTKIVYRKTATLNRFFSFYIQLNFI